VARRVVVLTCFIALLAAESGYFVRRCVGSVLRLQGERSFFRNRHVLAWSLYQKALAWGGDRERLETDMVELIVFGLDQIDAGIAVRTPLPPGDWLAVGKELMGRRLAEAPFRAYAWSLVSDLDFHAARLRRKATPIDLGRLSEDPLQNLLPEDWQALGALELATRLEPHNATYFDLLVEAFVEIGSPRSAAPFCREAVAALPSLEEHKYLTGPDLPPEMLGAALQGFEEALAQASAHEKAPIEVEAGRLLALHNDDGRALGYFQRASTKAPDFYDPHWEIGMLRFRLQDYGRAAKEFERATALFPETPWPNYYLGLSYRAMNRLEDAIVQFGKAKGKGPGDMRFFYALGESLESAHRFREAERQFVAAANLSPKDVSAWSELLAFYVRRGDGRSARGACERLLALRPNDQQYRTECASLEQGEP